MQKVFLMAVLSVLSFSVSAQSSILNEGEIAPCGYMGNPKYHINDPTLVTILYKQETMIHSPVSGKIISVFKIANNHNIIIQTPDGYYLTIGNIKETNLNKGVDIQKNTLIGPALPDVVQGLWSISITYNTKEKTLHCNETLEKMKLW